MNRQQVRDLLQGGYELDGVLLDTQGRTLARGKVKIEGATLLGIEDGNGMMLRLSHRGQTYDAPLTALSPVKRGEPVNIQFAKGTD